MLKQRIRRLGLHPVYVHLSPGFHTVSGLLKASTNADFPLRPVQPCKDCPCTTLALLPDRIIGRASQPPAWRQERNSLKKIGFSRTVFACEDHMRTIEIKVRSRMVTEHCEFQFFQKDRVQDIANINE